MNKIVIRQTFLLFILMLTTCLLLPAGHARGQEKQEQQRVRIRLTDATMQQAIEAIEGQTRYLFLNRGIDLTRRVTIQVADGTVQDALDQMLKGMDVTYEISGYYIILMPRQQQPAADTAVRGTVRSASGPVAGASVSVKGNPQGTITDRSGNFTLPGVGRGDTLRISSPGYSTVEIPYAGSANVTVGLQEEVAELDQIVVTALGIKREQKALSYNVQQVGRDDIITNTDANFLNSLSGKVAGAVINTSSSGTGGAVKVVMRGVKSINQTSNALYVIDGIPVHNFGGGGGTEFDSRGATEAIANINPDDIESVSALTGAAAAALYGSHAANGAILINTRQGKAGEVRISVSSGTDFLSPFVLPRFQNRYGTGSRGNRTGSVIQSWGPQLSQAAFRGYTPDDFFDTGLVFTNSVNLSGGTERNQTFVSAAALNSAGIVPNNRYNRYNFTFRNTSSFYEGRLTLDLGGTYVMQNDRNMTNQGVYSNPLVPAYLFPRGDDFSLTRSFERWDPSRKIMTMYWPQGEGDLRMQNPYWIAYRNLRENDKEHYSLSASLSWKATDWLTLTGRMRRDKLDGMYTQKLYASSNPTITEGSTQGYYEEGRANDSHTYGDILATFNYSSGDFSLMANAGASIVDTRSDYGSYQGPIRDGGIPNVFTVDDLDKTKSRARHEGWQEQTQSVFASVEAGWRSMLYLTVTGRNDWASQLAGSPHSSFFYPSVGLSWIASQTLRMPGWVDYLKLRGSYSSVGMPFPRHLTIPTYEYDETTLSWKPKTHYPVGDLYPERTNSWEGGFEARLLKDLSLSASFYRADTRNQTFDPQISVSSGYSTIYLQTGHVRNTGVEAMLNYGHTWKELHWDTGFSFSWNRNKIIELVKDYVHPETGKLISKDRLEIKGLGKAKFILKEGGSLGDLYTTSDLQRDANGNIDIGPDGTLVTLDNLPDIKLGSVLPKSNMAWRNTLSWKGIRAGFVFSARLGGIVYSATQAAMDQYGVSQTSAAARDAGGVVVNGRSTVDPETWYSAISAQSGLPQYYTYSATNVRLQEASLGYTLPQRWLGDIASVSVSLVGTNLWMIYNKAPFDPEAVATTENYYQGIDYFMMPSLRKLGFTIKINF